MRKYKIDDLEEGQVVGKTVYDNDYRVLIQMGFVLKREVIDKLRYFKIEYIYIDDEVSKDIEINDIISDETRQTLKTNMKQFSDSLIKGKDNAFDGIRDVLNFVMDEITTKKDLCIMISDIRSKDEVIFAHSANVCSMSIALGLKMGIEMNKIKDISIGALLHDLGKIEILKTYKKRYNELSSEELKYLNENHPRVGYDILGKDMSINPVSKVITLMHHEKEDGSGFPLKFNGAKIHQAAKIVAICNSFDNLVYGDIKENSMSVHLAIEYIVAMTNLYDMEIVKNFINIVAVFPNGTTVTLNTGEKAIVIRQNQGNPTRPMLRVIENNEKNSIDKPYEIDLIKELTKFIIA